MAKYLKVTVTRNEGTELYIEVPDDFDRNKLMRREMLSKLADIAEETCPDSFDWDDSDWKETLEVQSVSEVSEKEAKAYAMGRIEGLA